MGFLGIFGVRHHGPGSARSVVRALEESEPEIVLIEGPPEASDIIALARGEAMVPPVAILAYAVEDPRRAQFYPFATFSPEWQALRFALDRNVPVRFIDLPLANVLAESNDDSKVNAEANAVPDVEFVAADIDVPAGRGDPLGEIAKASGFPDGESWWDTFVERPRDRDDVFGALEDLMGATRARRPYENREEARREAAMRQAIRGARKEFGRVAVVCGAWHAPALRDLGSATTDAKILRGLPKTKVAATWIPWTHGRLARASGYGAGIDSPGWYEHLWSVPDDAIVTSWMSKAARTLRDGGLDITVAHAIEATRLAESLAALRDVSQPGLADLTDAIATVYCFGETAPLALLREKLIVAERLGVVPENGTNIPLLADLAREQKRLRLAPDPESRLLDLDLRKPNDLERSRLLHRLQLLGIPWGHLAGGRVSTGTFRERFELKWAPEFALALIERSAYGNSIVAAAEAFVRERAEATRDLAELTGLLHATLRSDVTGAVDVVLQCARDLAAQTHDVPLLMDAIPALAEVRRYGDVRRTDSESVGSVLEDLIVRACIGLTGASLALDDEAAEEMYARIVAVDGAIRILDRENERTAWDVALQKIASDDRIHGMLAGRATRILFDANVFDAEELRRRLGLALGRATEPAAAAAWIEGAFRKSGLVIVHQAALLEALDAWLSALDPETFTATLPLVRRTFGTFASPERAAIGERLASTSSGRGARGVASSGVRDDEVAIDWDRARALVPALRELLGDEGPGTSAFGGSEAAS